MNEKNEIYIGRYLCLKGFNAKDETTTKRQVLTFFDSMPQLILSTNRFYASVDFKEQSVVHGFDLMCLFKLLPQRENFTSDKGVHYRFISQWPI